MFPSLLFALRFSAVRYVMGKPAVGILMLVGLRKRHQRYFQERYRHEKKSGKHFGLTSGTCQVVVKVVKYEFFV